MSDSIENKVSSTRASLEQTLDEIEDRLNPAKQVSRLRGRAMSSYEANPVPWIVGATAVVIAIGGIIAWAVLSKDD